MAELRGPNIPQVYLWDQEAYRKKSTGLTLYKGIIIGIAGLLALFLTIIFVVKGAIIFPAAASLAWAVLAYACIDFGFLQRVFPITEVAERVYRASTEAVLGATLLVFLFAYLNLSRWHVRYSHVAVIWLLFLACLIGLAVFDPPVAAGVARISIAAVAGVGLLLIVYLAAHNGYDRAILLVPTWCLLLVWVVAAGFAITGQIGSDLVQPALIGGLVLIVMLIGFTVMQHAFAGGGLTHALVSDTERRALALTGAGDVVFDWDVPGDRVFAGQEIEGQLGLKRGSLEGPAANWLSLVHPFDVDRYSAALDTVIEERRGRIVHDFRLRSTVGPYYWYRLKARPVIGSDGEVIRVVGTISDVTEVKTAEERLLHDAVHDSLTGLPNRELFYDRLDAALAFASQDLRLKPTTIVLDIDRFKAINEAIGLSAGDSILLTLSRRLGRLLRPQDTLSRVAGDEFALILLSEREPDRILAFAEMIRKAIATPITYADREIFLTVSVGIALHEGGANLKREEVFKNAEMAMIQAKRGGGDRTEVFRATMRNERSDRLMLEADLRRALERNEMKVLFQPIVRLEDRTVAGFETLLRWDHPKLGRITPGDLPAHRGGERLHRQPRHLRPGAHGPRTGRLAAFARRRSADLRLRQRLVATAPAPRPPARREDDPRPFRRHPRLTEARDDREPGDGEPGIRGPDAPSHPRSRGRPLARRFRHRLFRPLLPPALPLRYDQDRSVLRPSDYDRPDGHPAVHRQDGSGTRSGDHRRGRGNRS